MDFLREPPAEWVARLREISPVTERLAHLVFRYREPKQFWYHDEQGQWELYSALPIAMVDRDRAEQFERHWSSLPKSQQQGRKSVVTEYQFHMWHRHQFYVERFMVLQGPSGATPAKYTVREKRYLDAMGYLSTPFPLGFFPAQPFDERAVRQIQARDRLVQAGHNLDALAKMDRPEALKAEDEAAEKLHRESYLKWWSEAMMPCKEYMKSQIAKQHLADANLPPAPQDLPNQLAQWKEKYIEHGHLIGATPARTRTVAMTVPGAKVA